MDLQEKTTKNTAAKYIDRKTAAERYGVSLRHMDGLIKNGIIPAARLGKRCLRIPLERADEVVARLETGGAR